MIVRLALRNIRRQTARTLMTLAAVVIGVIALVLVGGFVEDLFIQLGEAIIHSQTGHIQVYRAGFLTSGSRQPEKYLIDRPEQLARQLAGLPEVSQVTARLEFSGLINNGKRDLGIVGQGIEPDKEARIGTYLTIVAGRMMSDQDLHGIMLGQGVADSMGVQPGDPLTMLINTADGALNSDEFIVTGIFQSFSKDFDARAVRIPLGAAQQLLSTSGSNVLVVMLKATGSTDAVMARLPGMIRSAGAEASSWRQLSDFYDKSVDMYRRQFGVLQGIILIMVCLSVANSVNMSAFERLGEFGTMRALGNTAANVVHLLWIESLLLGLIGATIGVIVGVIAALLISQIGIPMPPPPNSTAGYTALIRVVPSIVVAAFLVGVSATFLASLIPAHRVSRVAVIDALRQNI